jgi:hypothetical protein
MELFEMTCRNCGGKLQIAKDAEQIMCQYCGSEYLITITEGAISLKKISEGLQNIQKSTDKTASELALVRIKEEKMIIFSNFNIKIRQGIDEDGIKLINGSNLLKPNEFLTECVEILEQQDKRFSLFKNDGYIRDLNKIIKRLEIFIPKYNKLVDEEKYHKKIVKIKI